MFCPGAVAVTFTPSYSLIVISPDVPFVAVSVPTRVFKLIPVAALTVNAPVITVPLPVVVTEPAEDVSFTVPPPALVVTVPVIVMLLSALIVMFCHGAAVADAPATVNAPVWLITMSPDAVFVAVKVPTCVAKLIPVTAFTVKASVATEFVVFEASM
jgi:hypothetical protein